VSWVAGGAVESRTISAGLKTSRLGSRVAFGSRASAIASATAWLTISEIGIRSVVSAGTVWLAIRMSS